MFIIRVVPGIDFQQLNTTITFAEDDLIAEVRVKVIDNEALQDVRAFSAMIEVTPGQIYPARIETNKATIEIEDDDSKSVNPSHLIVG